MNTTPMANATKLAAKLVLGTAAYVATIAALIYPALTAAGYLN